MATESVTAPMPTSRIYALPDGKLIFPGSAEHELMDLMHGMSRSEKRKLRELMRRVTSGELNVLKAQGWTQEQKRELYDSLPEAMS